MSLSDGVIWFPEIFSEVLNLDGTQLCANFPF